MAKTLARIFGGCWLILSSFSGLSQVSVPGGQRANVVASYRAQIGVRELTGHNDGTQVEIYLKTVGLQRGYAWCAAFIKWNLIQGKVAAASQIDGAAASCYSKSRMIVKVNLQPGDIFTLWFRSLGRIGHCGFVDGWANKKEGTVITVEGNTNGGGSRDGDGTYRRIRQVGSVYAICNWID